MEALQYILGSFWRFLGFIIIVGVTGSVIVGVIKALRGDSTIHIEKEE